MKEKYIAHFDEKERDRIQTVSCHNKGVSFLTEKNCPLDYLRSIAWLTGIFHDCGKYHDEFYNYICEARDNPDFHRRKVTHSTAGGLLIDELVKNKLMSEFIQFSIFSHHGLKNCFSLDSGETLIEKRKVNMTNLSLVSERFYQYVKKEEILNYIKCAEQDFQKIQLAIIDFVKTGGKEQKYGNAYFFLGLYERILLSLLIDSDRLDTIAFAEKTLVKTRKKCSETKEIWEKAIFSLEERLKRFKGKGALNECRMLISNQCKEMAFSADSLYRLTVPTGAGKTLCNLRYALYHAREFKKLHIIYVAPYNSILEQNAEEIRDTVGDDEMVLEHHSNVVFELNQEEEVKKYQLLTENWDCPIIVTTAVQLLNTLFSSKSGSIRRTYNLCNSVIIFDEIQALPIRITGLFNLATNFLTQFCKTTVVLCSATQPLFDQLPSNRLLPTKNMVVNIEKYETAFKRTIIIDKTEDGSSGGWNIDTVGEFISNLLLDKRRILVIVNTKKTAEELYYFFSKKYDESECSLFHLSTNMCSQNRKDILKPLKEELTKKIEQTKPILCISTQLIEAGVDISFPCVIRSLAGLDNIIQAAGRCNRNGKDKIGEVYIIRMSEEAEKIPDSLKDIKIAQDTMKRVLYQYRTNSETLNNCLASKQAMEFYYKLYMSRRLEEMKYQVSIKGKNDASLVELLSSNNSIWKSFHGTKKLNLKQAFKTAGDEFEVIENQGKIDVIVEYDKKAKYLIDQLKDEYRSLTEKKKDLRNLQPYMVGIEKQKVEKLKSVISQIWDGRCLILSENYYSKKTGVSQFPVGMDFLIS